MADSGSAATAYYDAALRNIERARRLLHEGRLGHRVGANSGGEITLRATRLWDVVPGEIAVVQPNKHWTYPGNP